MKFDSIITCLEKGLEEYQHKAPNVKKAKEMKEKIQSFQADLEKIRSIRSDAQLQSHAINPLRELEGKLIGEVLLQFNTGGRLARYIRDAILGEDNDSREQKTRNIENLFGDDEEAQELKLPRERRYNSIFYTDTKTNEITSKKGHEERLHDYKSYREYVAEEQTVVSERQHNLCKIALINYLNARKPSQFSHIDRPVPLRSLRRS